MRKAFYLKIGCTKKPGTYPGFLIILMTTNRKAVRLVVGVHVGIAAVEVQVLTVIAGIITTPVVAVSAKVVVASCGRTRG